jgi:GntR family transcriptional regulator
VTTITKAPWSARWINFGNFKKTLAFCYNRANYIFWSFAMLINRRDKLPLYQQLYEILRNKIKSKEWQVGQLIPSEPELMTTYGISRVTVRQVLDRLVNDGLIYRQRGKGSFVASPTLEQSIARIVSFTEDMQQRDLQPGTKVMKAELIPAAEEVAKHLQVEPGTEMAYLERLRFANNEPMSIEQSFLVHSMVNGILQYDYVVQPLREIIKSIFGIQLVRAKQVIRAFSATQRLAHVLEVPVNAPLLFIERISFSQHDQPVEFLRIYYRGDRYSLYSEMHD